MNGITTPTHAPVETSTDVIYTPYRFTFFKSTTTTKGAPQTWTWDEIVAWLTEDQIHAGPKDTLPGWSPATFERNERDGANVREVSLGVVDLDEVAAEDVDALHARLRALQLDYAWHSSYSHLLTCRTHNKRARKDAASRGADVPAECPPDCAETKAPKFRFVIRLSRTVSAREWSRVWSGLAELAPRLDPNCKDAGRFYFVPGHRPGTVFEADSHAGGHALDVETLIAHAVASGKDPSPGDVPTPKAWRKLANYHADGMSAARAIGGRAMLALLDREPFAPEGQRDTALFQMAAILADKYQNTPPALLVDLVREELVRQTEGEKWAQGDGAAELEAKIKRAQGQREDKVAAENKAACRSIGREGLYTDAEIREAVAQLGLRDAEELTRQLLITHGSEVYVFYKAHDAASAYLGPYRGDSAELAARSYLAAATVLPSVTLQELTKDGFKPKPYKALLRDHGRVAQEIRLSYAATCATFSGEEAGGVLTLPVSPLDPQLKPQHSPRAADFLDRFLGGPGEARERGLDWLATLTDARKAAPALYVVGPKGTGKTVLGVALGGLYGQKACTSLARAGQRFNAALLACRVVHADEKLPTNYRGQVEWDGIKSLIADTAHNVERKGSDATRTVEGTIRLLVTLNRDDHGREQGLTAEDADAIQDRVIYIEQTEAAQLPDQYFAAANGWTEDYIAEIASHILWLVETRGQHVKPGRFVCKSFGDFGVRLLVSGSQHNAALTHVLKALESGVLQTQASNNAVQASEPGVIALDGQVLVCAGSIAEQSDSFSAFQARPSRQVLAKLFNSLCHPGIARDSRQTFRNATRRAYRQLRLDLLQAAARELDWSEAQLQAGIARLQAACEAALATQSSAETTN